MAHPERLGKYQITGVLGEGAMGVVYKGFDPDIRRVVALKTIRRASADSGESAETSAARFRNEAHAAGRLTHPGIVGVYDFGDDGHVAYIAMEFVEGHTLSTYLAQKVQIGPADVASIIGQLLDALSHAHENGVWHRDIKPSNVIMTRGGRVKIADFGIARTEDAGLTMAGGIVGTPMYMAPEQFLGQAIDHRVDIYGAGVVLYQLIAGRPPFVGSANSLIYRVVHEAPQPPSTVEGALRLSDFDGVALRALAKDAQGRYASAAAFRQALSDALGQALAPKVSDDTITALPLSRAYETTQRMPPPSTASRSASASNTTGSVAHWDPAVLAQLESALAKHVGPLAGTMVRRAARDCADLPTLQTRLAEQITQSSVREAFLGQLRGSGHSTGTMGAGGMGTRSTHVSSSQALPHGTGSNAGTRSSAPSPTGGFRSSAPPTGGSRGSSTQSRVSAPVSDAWLEQAQRILAGHVGPIAKVVLKRATDRTRQRAALSSLLADAVPDADRAKLLAELDRLPP